MEKRNCIEYAHCTLVRAHKTQLGQFQCMFYESVMYIKYDTT